MYPVQMRIHIPPNTESLRGFRIIKYDSSKMDIFPPHSRRSLRRPKKSNDKDCGQNKTFMLENENLVCRIRGLLHVTH